MKNLLTKTLFILSLSLAVIPSGVQAACFVENVKKITKEVLKETSVKEKIALGLTVVLVTVYGLAILLVPTRPSMYTINGRIPLTNKLDN